MTAYADGSPGSLNYAYDSLGSLYARTIRPAAPFAFADDFSSANDISNWTQPSGAGYPVWATGADNGQSVLGVGNNLSSSSDIWRGGAVSGGFSYFVKMRVTASPQNLTGNTAGGAGIFFRSDNTAASIDKNEYYLCLRPLALDKGGALAPEWDLYKVTAGNWGALASGPLALSFANLSLYHAVGVMASGTTYTIYIDGVPVCKVNDSTFTSGLVGPAAYLANVNFAAARLEGPTGTSTAYYRYNEVSGALQAELDASGNVTAAYATSPNGGPISVTRTVNGVKGTYFYHVNAHGDVTSITDANGNLVANFTYDAWGVPTELTASGQSVPIGTWAGAPGEGLFFLFGGMLYDAAAGLYLTKTRVYDPRTGRFLSRDILDESGKNGVYKGFPFGRDAIGTNLYGWCGNNPMTRVDPSGKYYVDAGYQDWIDTGSYCYQDDNGNWIEVDNGYYVEHYDWVDEYITEPDGNTYVLHEDGSIDLYSYNDPNPGPDAPSWIQGDSGGNSSNGDSQAQEEAQREREAEYEREKEQSGENLQAEANANHQNYDGETNKLHSESSECNGLQTGIVQTAGVILMESGAAGIEGGEYMIVGGIAATPETLGGGLIVAGIGGLVTGIGAAATWFGGKIAGHPRDYCNDLINN